MSQPESVSLQQRVAAMDSEEITVLLTQVHQLTGVDFRDYSLPMIKRRIRHLLELRKFRNIAELSRQIEQDEGILKQLVAIFCVTVSAMYRDPDVFLSIRKNILPILRAKPFIRIWHAGCATGEEVYSFAIMLEQEGFQDRYRSYATDLDWTALEQAKSGYFPMRTMQSNTKNYLKSGGIAPFSEYYDSYEKTILLKEYIKRNVVFGRHNLVSDPAFNQFDLIFCRNVLIYFNNTLQERVLNKLRDSLLDGGMLILGSREPISFAYRNLNFEVVSREFQIFKKRNWEVTV